MTETVKAQRARQWRLDKIRDKKSHNLTNREIAQSLQIHESVVSRDMKYLDKQAIDNLSKYTELLPIKMDRALAQVEYMLRQAWQDYHNAKTSKERCFISQHINDYNDIIAQIIATGPKVNLMRRIQKQQEQSLNRIE